MSLTLIFADIGLAANRQRGAVEKLEFATDTRLENLDTSLSLGSKQYTEAERRRSEAYLEGLRLYSLGEEQFNSGNWQAALANWNQALTIFQDIQGPQGGLGILIKLGTLHLSLGEYEKALTYYEKSLVISREVGDQTVEGSVLNNIGNIYRQLGEYPEALNYYTQSLVIDQEMLRNQGARSSILVSVANTINNVGIVYQSLGEYLQALDYYKQSLDITQGLIDTLQIFDRTAQAVTLNNIGNIYQLLGEYSKALDYYKRSLVITKGIDNPASEARILNNIGAVHWSLGEHLEALENYEQSLVIARQVGNRAGEAGTLANIARLLQDQNKPALAIIFFKQAVNAYETIRTGIQSLDQSLQDSFTKTIEDEYRTLADLLLQQGRILEAQRVLDLLKVQELDDYLRGVQRSPATQNGVAYWQVEEELLQLYRELLLAGEQLRLLQNISFNQLTPEQKSQLSELTARQGYLQDNFQQWVEHPEVASALTDLRTSTKGRNLEIEDYATLQSKLAGLPQNTVLLYPLILENRLELVLVSPYAPPVRHPVEVSADELNRVITNFGQSLKYARSDIETHAQQLYNWLIKPLEESLSSTDAEMIIFAPDGPLRYVPLAALHDGNDWLVERFSFTHITAAALTNFDAKPQDNPRLLAAACSECNFEYKVAGQDFQFSLLPYTDSEVSLLEERMPNTDVLRTPNFTPEELQLRLGSYEILHLATHGAFVTGQPEESFIVFGDKSRLNLKEIERKWNLPNADLVVLSACETAVGSDGLGTGVEILGLGYQIQKAGAKAAIASLWQVSDGGTQVLMNAFYTAIANGKTKAEALQLAQQALLTGDGTASGLPRGGLVPAGIPNEVANSLDHPYYWAPFILIGNGL
ncbi:MAG: CHAT domain-containing protein [Leptolyngbya sp. SIO3F4]|nr:CHAT domain-containing protein [Leptolyngbya sp. SIO3F4]